MTPRPTLSSLAADFRAGRATSRALVDAALARIADPASEGSRVFTKVYADHGAAPRPMRRTGLRTAGYVASPLAAPVSIKDLFERRGRENHARRVPKALDDAAPAKADAAIVARLKAAGAVIVGRTNMTEFAFLRGSASTRTTAHPRQPL